MITFPENSSGAPNVVIPQHQCAHTSNSLSRTKIFERVSRWFTGGFTPQRNPWSVLKFKTSSGLRRDWPVNTSQPGSMVLDALALLWSFEKRFHGKRRCFIAHMLGHENQSYWPCSCTKRFIKQKHAWLLLTSALPDRFSLRKASVCDFTRLPPCLQAHAHQHFGSLLGAVPRMHLLPRARVISAYGMFEANGRLASETRRAAFVISHRQQALSLN